MLGLMLDILTKAVWPGLAIKRPGSIPATLKAMRRFVVAHLVSLATVNATHARVVVTHRPADQRAIGRGVVLVRNLTRRICNRSARNCSCTINKLCTKVAQILPSHQNSVPRHQNSVPLPPTNEILPTGLSSFINIMNIMLHSCRAGFVD